MWGMRTCSSHFFSSPRTQELIRQLDAMQNSGSLLGHACTCTHTRTRTRTRTRKRTRTRTQTHTDRRTEALHTQLLALGHTLLPSFSWQTNVGGAKNLVSVAKAGQACIQKGIFNVAEPGSRHSSRIRSLRKRKHQGKKEADAVGQKGKSSRGIQLEELLFTPVHVEHIHARPGEANTRAPSQKARTLVLTQTFVHRCSSPCMMTLTCSRMMTSMKINK